MLQHLSKQQHPAETAMVVATASASGGSGSNYSYFME